MKKILLMVMCFAILVPVAAYSHPGKTDSKGGHYNRKTGEYHYHNRGASPSPLSTKAPAKKDTTAQSEKKNIGKWVIEKSKGRSMATLNAEKGRLALVSSKQGVNLVIGFASGYLTKADDRKVHVSYKVGSVKKESEWRQQGAFVTPSMSEAEDIVSRLRGQKKLSVSVKDSEKKTVDVEFSLSDIDRVLDLLEEEHRKAQ